MAHFVHERVDQQQAAAADALEICRIGRIGQAGRIEAGAFVADRIANAFARFASGDVNPPLLIGRLLPALGQQLVLHPFVGFAQFGTGFEVAMLDRVGQRFAEGHADPRLLRLVE